MLAVLQQAWSKQGKDGCRHCLLPSKGNQWCSEQSLLLMEGRAAPAAAGPSCTYPHLLLLRTVGLGARGSSTYCGSKHPIYGSSVL